MRWVILLLLAAITLSGYSAAANAFGADHCDEQVTTTDSHHAHMDASASDDADNDKADSSDNCSCSQCMHCHHCMVHGVAGSSNHVASFTNRAQFTLWPADRLTGGQPASLLRPPRYS